MLEICLFSFTHVVLFTVLIARAHAKVYDIGGEPVSHGQVPLPPSLPDNTFEFLSWVRSDYGAGSYLWLSTGKAMYEDAIEECEKLHFDFKGVPYYGDLLYYLNLIEPAEKGGKQQEKATFELLAKLKPKVTMWVGGMGDFENGTEMCNIYKWAEEEGSYKADSAPCSDEYVTLCTGKAMSHLPNFDDFIDYDYRIPGGDN